MNFLALLSSLISEHTYLVCVILLIAVTFEGELALLILGILAHSGGLPIYNALLIGLVGAILKTLWSYYAGVALFKYIPTNPIFNFIEHKVLVFFPNFKDKPFWSIFFSKFVYGFNHFTSIFSGYTKVPFALYVKAELSSSILWLALMFNIGYFFSYTAFSITKNIQKALIVLLLCIIGYLILSKIINVIIESLEQE